MKKLLLIATALTISISSFSQKKEVASKVIIAGNLKNYEAKEIRFGLTYKESIAFEEGDFKITLEADEAKIYRISIIPGESAHVAWDDPDKEKYIAFSRKQNERSFFELFLSPGDSIYLTADFMESLADFKLAGDHAAENLYLFEKRIPLLGSIRNKLMDYERSLNAIGYRGNWMTFMGLNKDEYFYTKDSLLNVLRNKFEPLKANNAIDPEFIKLEEAYFQYQPIVLDQDYSFYHAVIHRGMDKTTGNVNMDGIDFPIAQVNAELAKIDLNRPDLLASYPYTSLIYSRIAGAAKDIMKQDSTLKNNSEGFHKARLMAIDQLLSNQLMKDHFRYNYIKPIIEMNGPAYAKADYDQFMKEQQSPKLAAQLKESYDKWDTILPGKDLPDFNFININGDSVKLSELRGTLVYIDIWATWCGPCIAEHPHWDKLREEYKDKAVSFLTISVDNSKAAWEKMVKAKNMEGLQWYAPNAFSSELASHFMVRGIPRFLLLDREGKIIDPSADRPSGDIKAMLDQHL